MKKYKKYLYVFIIFLICLSIFFEFFSIAKNVVRSAGAGVVNWGVFYLESGKKPRGNSSEDYLKQFNAYFVAPTEEKVIYLTFDSGYENGFTSKIIDILKEQNVPAAFFLTGYYLKTNPEIVKKLVSDGFIIGNHSMTHSDMSVMDFKSFETEIKGFETKYKEITKEDALKYYRPPCGIFSENSLKYACDLGYKTILWSSAYLDWDNNNQPSAQTALDTIMPRVHPGAIILLHSTSKTNSEILARFIKQCRDIGYTFKSLDELP
jgi:peptidoglycan-N-acetylmuramic acid deacetylase